jgi:hypothetical protein
MERAWLQAGDVHPALHAHLQAYPDVAAMKLPWAISLFQRVPGTLFQLSKRRRLWALGPLGPARAPGQKGGSFGDVGLWALAGDPHPGRVVMRYWQLNSPLVWFAFLGFVGLPPKWLLNPPGGLGWLGKRSLTPLRIKLPAVPAQMVPDGISCPLS